MDQVFAIEARNVTKYFNEFLAVDNLNLQIKKGHIYGFVGPNGAGKTTTIKMFAGLSKPTSGEVFINGQQVICGKIDKLNVGYLPDVPGFYGWMRATEFMLLCGQLLNIDSIRLTSMIDELLTLVGLKGVKTRIRGYSRGMKQRLGIAQALLNNPPVIFLDEPASALDPLGRKEIMDVILSLKGKVTVFFSTHIISDVEKICDKILIMNKGKILMDTDINSLMNSGNIKFVNLKVSGDGLALESFTKALSDKSWANAVDHSGNGSFKIELNSIDTVGKELPFLISNAGLSLDSYETGSNLETIFLEVVQG